MRARLGLLTAACVLAPLAAFGYGGMIGPNEFQGAGATRTATDFKNPLPSGTPHHYHVTLCNDGAWLGVWYPLEWKGNKGGVAGAPGANAPHAFAKQEEGSGSANGSLGVQLMGNGQGGTTDDLALSKQEGDTVFLSARVVDCAKPLATGALRGRFVVGMHHSHRPYTEDDPRYMENYQPAPQQPTTHHHHESDDYPPPYPYQPTVHQQNGNPQPQWGTAP